MITPAQIRAARALLGWSQSQLAEKAGVSRNALNNLEREVVAPRRSTVKAIQQTLEQAGIEFTEGGVRPVTPQPKKDNN